MASFVELSENYFISFDEKSIFISSDGRAFVVVKRALELVSSLRDKLNSVRPDSEETF